MTTLHTINQPPSQAAIWSALLGGLNRGDSVLLIEDACYATLDPELLSSLALANDEKQVALYILESDIRSRGLGSTADQSNDGLFTLADYAQFVELAAQTDKSVSWHR